MSTGELLVIIFLLVILLAGAAIVIVGAFAFLRRTRNLEARVAALEEEAEKYDLSTS